MARTLWGHSSSVGYVVGYDHTNSFRVLLTTRGAVMEIGPNLLELFKAILICVVVICFFIFVLSSL